jgi:hypothetical protein
VVATAILDLRGCEAKAVVDTPPRSAAAEARRGRSPAGSDVALLRLRDHALVAKLRFAVLVLAHPVLLSVSPESIDHRRRRLRRVAAISQVGVTAAVP